MKYKHTKNKCKFTGGCQECTEQTGVYNLSNMNKKLTRQEVKYVCTLIDAEKSIMDLL